jgi:hypothetical protein
MKSAARGLQKNAALTCILQYPAEMEIVQDEIPIEVKTKKDH